MKLKSILGKALKTVILAALICAVSLEAPYVHRKYIRTIAEASVVQIYGQEGTGTGSHVKLPNGKVVILTNKHICQMTGPLMVKAENRPLPIERKIIKISDKHDLCAIEAIPDEEGIPLGSNPTIGDELYVLGHPRGEALNVSIGEYFSDKIIEMGDNVNKDGGCDEGKLETAETIFGTVTYCSYKRNTIQFSNPSYPGNSGSPILNKYGNLVGVLFAGDSGVENQGYGVPLIYVSEFLSSLK